MKQVWRIAIPAAALVACGQDPAQDDDDATATPAVIDEALLETYRQAIPDLSLLEAAAPEASAAARVSGDATGEPAIFPQQAVPVASGINDTIASMLSSLEAVVQLPPTLYDPTKPAFVWGPFDNDGSDLEGDTIYVYIEDEGEGSSSFRYTYAFIRAMGNDTSTASPVIWGGTTPVDEYTVSGVSLWDYEANYTWEETYNPDHGALTRGRFADVFARDWSDDDPTALVTIVVAAFRDFLPEDADEDTAPIDLDYLWGNVSWPDAQVDFMDFAYQADIDDSTSALEQVGEQLAFYNSGVGRSEVDITDGDVPADYPGHYIQAAECWDSALLETYLEYALAPEDPASEEAPTVVASSGDAGDCALSSLEDIPSLDDVDEDLLALLDELASDGVPAAEKTAPALASKLRAVKLPTP